MSDSDHRMNFNPSLPPGWHDQTVYHFRGPEIDGMPHVIVVIIDRNMTDPDLASFVERQTDPLRYNLQGIEILKDESITIDGGNQAHEFVYQWIPGEGVRLYQKYVFVIKDGMGFTISGSFSKRSLKMLGGQMTQLIETLLPGTYEQVESD